MSTVKKLQGRTWIFGDLLDVDVEICDRQALKRLTKAGAPLTYELAGKYCMTVVDSDFPNKIKKGDFIIAGQNFGYGHDHHTGCMAIRGAGIAAVICESTNCNFVRNSIHHGLPVIACKGIKEHVHEGDYLEIDLAEGTITNQATGKQLTFYPFPDFLLEIIDAGGLYPYLEQQIREGRLSAPVGH